MADIETLYHGSKVDFDEFEIQKMHTNGGTLGYGIYLTDSRERAETYSDENYLYTVSLDDEAIKSDPLSNTEITLEEQEVSKIIQDVAQSQIENDGYPYILSDWEEPTSDTEMDSGNISIANRIATSLMDNESDLDIINDLANQLGGNDSGASVLNPILDKNNIHYGVIDTNFDDSLLSKEYVVFNPNDIKIIDKTNIRQQNMDYQDKTLLIDGKGVIGELDGKDISFNANDIAYYTDQALNDIGDLKRLSNNMLSAVTVNLIDHTHATYQEIIKLPIDHNDREFWANDYSNEIKTYTELSKELNNRGIQVPQSIDLDDKQPESENTKKILLDKLSPIANQNLKDIANESLIVHADDRTTAVKKLFNNNLKEAMSDTYTLSDLSQHEAQEYLKNPKWQDVVDMETDNNLPRYLGNDMYTDEFIKVDKDNPYQENSKILSEAYQQKPSFNTQYKKLKSESENQLEQNKQTTAKLNHKKNEISETTQKELKSYVKNNPEIIQEQDVEQKNDNNLSR